MIRTNSVLMQTVTEDIFKTAVHHNDDISIKTQPSNNPWFTVECCQYRDSCVSILNRYRKRVSDENSVTSKSSIGI